jgi:hypothetical protein
MAGIYIYNMELPTSGNETIIRIHPDGSILDQYGHHLDMKAIQVYDYDDLIERGALISAYDAEHVGPPGRARELMLEAKAVIPADKEMDE